MATGKGRNLEVLVPLLVLNYPYPPFFIFEEAKTHTFYITALCLAFCFIYIDTENPLKHGDLRTECIL